MTLAKVNTGLIEFAQQHLAEPGKCGRCGNTRESGLRWAYGYDDGRDPDYVGYQCQSCGNVQGLRRDEIGAAADGGQSMAPETAIRTPFPERMRNQAAGTHARRAQQALKDLAYEVAVLQRRLDNGTAEGHDARKTAELAATIGAHFGALEVLREIREWDEAEKAGEPS